MTTLRSSRSLAFTLAALLPPQEPQPGVTAQLTRLHEQLLAARSLGDQSGAVTVLQQLCQLQPQNGAPVFLLAQTHASLGPEFDPRRTVELCSRFLELTDPAQPAAAARLDDVLAAFATLGVPRPADVRALRVQARQLQDQYARPAPERLLLWPDRTALARKVSLLATEHDRIDRDKASAARSLAAAKTRLGAAEAEYAKARKATAGKQLVDTTELWTRVLDRREEVQTSTKRCDRLGRELEAARSELDRHRARLRTFDFPANR